MKVCCNGFPKSGTHALCKAVELLGVPAGDSEHIPTAESLPSGTTHHIFIIRDPRNIIVSWLRWTRDAVTPGKFLARFRMFQRRTLIEEMAEFEPWLADQHTLVVRYERLIENDAEMRRIAKYLGVPYMEGAWEALPNHTRTWNAEHSDYQSIWTPDVEVAWRGSAGPALLTCWGY